MSSKSKVVLASVSIAALVALGACQTLAPSAGRPPGVAGGAAAVAPAVAPAPAREAGPAGMVAPSASSQIVAPPGPVTGNPTGIVAVGQGQVLAEPDIAHVTTGVQTRGRTAQQAQDENTRLINAVLQAIRAAGVADRDVRTSGVALHPVFEQQPNAVSGYEATNTVRVTAQDVTKTGRILDAAVGAGANIAGDVQFGLKDGSAVRRQALDQAVKEARADADAIASAAGLRVVGVLALIDESGGGGMPPPMPMATQAAAGDAVPIQPGQLAVTARVRAIYSFQ